MSVVEKAKKLLEGITPGRWFYNAVDCLVTCEDYDVMETAQWESNGKLMAAAPTIVRELVAEVERLREQNHRKPQVQ